MGKKMIGQNDGQYFLPSHFCAENCSLRTLGFPSLALRRVAAKKSRSPSITPGGSACVGAVKKPGVRRSVATPGLAVKPSLGCITAKEYGSDESGLSTVLSSVVRMCLVPERQRVLRRTSP
jgi:hypothetical protein